MLTKLTDTISFSLLPFLSALFIAVGMPLLHPVLHSYSENYHIVSEHCDEHISVFANEDHEPNCPICDFLATSQLYDTGIGRTITEIEPVGKIISIKNIFLAKTHPLQIERHAMPTRSGSRNTSIKGILTKHPTRRLDSDLEQRAFGPLPKARQSQR